MTYSRNSMVCVVLYSQSREEKKTRWLSSKDEKNTQSERTWSPAGFLDPVPGTDSRSTYALNTVL